MLQSPKINRVFLLLLTFMSISHLAHATHNRAGEISIEQVGDCTESLTIKATIVTYTKASSRPADRDSLTICWGDGNCESVLRSNGPGFPPQGIILENDTKKNIYVAFHTFPARGTYVISMTDPNRNGGILNVNFPNSEQIKFHIQTTYTFPNPQFQGCNNTPVLLQPPIDIACIGKIFTHNPNAWDADGDSLSYHEIVPLSDVGVTVPNYKFPFEIEAGPNNSLNIDPVTGDIEWSAPQRAGEYNYAIIIVEYREGIPIDTIIRDMQILVKECENEPPTVETSVDEICVIAGEIVEIEVIAGAPTFEVNQRVRLTALGGPFEVPISPATFEPNDNRFLDDPVGKLFRWETTCEHISDQYYSVVFRAVDDFFGDTSGLATLKTVRIKVIGPPPQDLEATPEKERITVTWQKPYVCENAEDDYFRGFTVWRRLGSNAFPQDTCLPGLEGRGYTKLTPTAILDMIDGRYVFEDSNVERGRTYCYRILAEFARTTPTGSYTYNRVESLPSDEICLQLGRDVPLINKVDVLTTSATEGQIEVCWTKPLANDLDTVLNPGPYRYEVLRGEIPAGGDLTDVPLTPIGISFESEFFATANDTCFTDLELNTAGNIYFYQVAFYVSNESSPLGETNEASSIYLSITPSDQVNLLSWDENVPWDNFEYVVLRKNAQGTFDTLGTVFDPFYSDDGLENGFEYCYKILSRGSYGIPGIASPLLNHSQEACAIPQDDVAPCPPMLTVSNICDQNINCSDENNLFNTLNWNHPREECENVEDVDGYNIYYAPFEDAELTLVARIDGPNTFTFDHQPESGIAGFYAVTAIDTVGNESEFSNVVRVDNCPSYQLPNAFTPNNDGQNDIFRPYPFCFIESVNFKVFNRWGQIVFETNDPNLNWDGTNLSGQELAEGTYYYTCQVFARGVNGVEPLNDEDKNPSGWIFLAR